MMSNSMNTSTFQLAIGLIPPEEAGMLLNHITKEEKVYLLVNLIKLSEAGFPVISKDALPGYPSLGIFWNPYKRIGEILMALSAYHNAEEIAELILAIAQKTPDFEDEIRPYMLCFEEVIYLSDLEMQTILRREGLNPFLLIDTSAELLDFLLKSVSTRVKKDAQLRLEELNNVSEIEKIVNSKQALHQKAKFVKLVLEMRAAKEIEGPYVPLTLSEIDLIPKKIEDLVKRISLFEDSVLSFWLNEVVDLKDLALLCYWGPADFSQKIDCFLTRQMRDIFEKSVPKKDQTSIGRKEIEAFARLKKIL